MWMAGAVQFFSLGVFMVKRLIGIALLVVATGLNLRLFFSRWAELPREPLPEILSQVQVASAVSGFGAMALVMSVIGLLWMRRWLLAISLAILAAAVVALLQGVPAFASLYSPMREFALGGALVALICLQLRESEEPSGARPLGWSFALLAFASLNFFLLCGPYSSHLPSYVQDSVVPPPTLRVFYYGSVHSDLSIVSIYLRHAINWFFPYPSINATAVSSMVYVSLGLALCGIALHMMFGSLWAWVFLALAWTDRWLFASAISSSIIGHPVLSTAFSVFLCTWAIVRRPGLLTWREAAALACINAVGLLYNLYSYSAARMPWVVGSAMAAAILLFRRAVRLNLDGVAKVSATVIPSIALLVLIWATLFERDTDRFKSQIFISPKMSNLIKDVNDYPKKVYPIHDNDIPIWWGTGRPEEENVSVYWRRSPQEIIEKLGWMMNEISAIPPLPAFVIILAALGVIVGVTSPQAKRRWFTVVILVMGGLSFATFMFAQDPSAYRRGMPTNLLVFCAVVSLFAMKARGRYFKVLAALPCVALAIVKAPEELNVLTNETFYSPVCIACQSHVNFRGLVNDPAFAAVAGRPLRILISGKGVPPVVMRCSSTAIESNEFKSMSPLASEFRLSEGESLEAGFSRLVPGEVLLVACTPASEQEPEIKDVCSGRPPFGRLLGQFPKSTGNISSWWILIERA
jgi:hypothetical protein